MSAVVGTAIAAAASLVNPAGTVTLTPVAPFTAVSPFSSGQTIDITLGTNSALAAPNNAGITVIECQAPNGVLPSVPTNNCDQTTGAQLASGTVNADGSIAASAYTVYALPNTLIGESASPTQPTCGLAPNYCVLYIGPALGAATAFPDAHLFSAPFVVAANADDGGENPGDGTPAPATGTSGTNSTVAVSTTAAVVADGVDQAQITVALKDTTDAPVLVSKEVMLSQGSGNSTINGGGAGADETMTNSSGEATFTVTDTTVESVTYSVTDLSDSVPLASTVSVVFVAPVVKPSACSIETDESAVASGSSATITVNLNDQAVNAQPIAGKTISLSEGSGHATISALSATTDAQGQATFSVSDTTAEQVVFTATDTTDSVPLTGNSVAVTFGTLSVSATASTVTGPGGPVEASASGSGAGQGVVTVTLLAGDGTSPVPGKDVTLAASSAGAVISPASPVTTGSAGTAVFDVADPNVESVTFTATDATDSVALVKSATVAFQTPAVSPTKSTMTISSTTGPADGVTPAVIEVSLEDQFGQAIAGKAITLSGSPSSTVRIAPQQIDSSVVSGTTDATGHAQFFALDTTAEAVTFTATETADNVVFAGTVVYNFASTLPESSQSSITVSPSSVAADGTTAATISVKLLDHNQNPVAGKTMTLTALSGSSTVSPTTATTDSTGVASFSVTDSTAEAVTYEATDTTDHLPLAGQSAVVTFGPLEPDLPDPNFSSVVANGSSVPADGQSGVTIDVDLSDANGLPIVGRVVALDPSGGSSTVTPLNATTDATGVASFVVSDTTNEAVTYSATDTSDNVAIAGQTAMVDFTPAPVTTTTTTIPVTTTTTTVPVTTTTVPGKEKATATATETASAKVTSPATATATATVTSSATARGVTKAAAKSAAKVAAIAKAKAKAKARAEAKAEAKAKAEVKSKPKDRLQAKAEEKAKPESIVGVVAPPDSGGDEGL